MLFKISVFGFEGTKPSESFDLPKTGKKRSFFLGILRSKFLFLDSSMVEHSAVNRVVVGSSPTRGVNQAEEKLAEIL